jgi:hypothetical protein
MRSASFRKMLASAGKAAPLAFLDHRTGFLSGAAGKTLAPRFRSVLHCRV